MTYVVYFANSGVATTGLTLTWEYLKKVSDGTDYSQPSFTEIGGGWYKFDYTGTSDLVGVVDGSSSLGNSDRYVPLYLSSIDQVDKAVWNYSVRTLGSN